MLNRKEKTVLFFFAALILGAVVYSIDRLLLNSLLTWQFLQKPYLLMLGELALVFILFLILGLFGPAKIKFPAIIAVLSVFLWLHQVLLPIAASGLYAAWLWLCGRWLCGRIFACSRSQSQNTPAFLDEFPGKAFSREFLTGCLFALCCFCLMSALGIGKIENLWIFIFDVTTVLALDLRFWKKQRAALGQTISALLSPPKTINQKTSRYRNFLILAAILTLFCIQAGRMNIAVDFDSLWYGARSPYILNNGGGIYENLGTIGVVYTYSKGLEVLTMPLSVLPSYSFVIAFNLWLAAGVLMQAWMIGRFYLRKSAARFMLLFLASLPGIMNMTVTAKTDMATLYIQLMMLCELICFLKGEQQAFWYAWGAFFFSWTLKPTAMVFSTAVMGMSTLYFIVVRKVPASASPKNFRPAFFTFILSLFALIGIWARTFLLTGLPVTSVFSSVLTRIGFQMNYPFNSKTIPNNNAGTAPSEVLKSIGSRIYGILFNPQGKDLDHVIIAWGSLSTWFFICVLLSWFFLDKKARTDKERMLDGFFNTMFLPLSLCCLLSLIMLYQVDGNYFMLFYVLSALCAFRLTERLANQTFAGLIRALGLPVILFSVIITTLTNWAWAMGFTPISLAHQGYYPHQEENYRVMAASGNRQIWEILAQNPRTRLISIGDHPQSLLFPCCSQSYREITKNAWGNPELVETTDNFIKFLEYAKTDYIYAQADYLSLENPAWNLLCDLIARGVLTPLCYEEGNMLAYVDSSASNTPPSENGQALLEEFKEKYNAWTKEDESGMSNP